MRHKALKLPSKKQAQVLAFIKAYISTNGYAPTVNEIKADLGVSSTNGVHQHLNALEAKGLISRKRAAARAIVVLEAPAQLAEEEAAPLSLVELWAEVALAYGELEDNARVGGARLGGADERLKLALVELRRKLKIPAQYGDNEP